MGHGAARIGTSGVFGLSARHGISRQRRRSRPRALWPRAAVIVLIRAVHLRHRPPAAERRVAQMGLHIGHSLGRNGQIIARNPRSHGCIKGICCGIVPCQPNPARLRFGPSPNGFQARQIGQNLGRRRAIVIADPQVHRAMAAQRAKACVHLGRDHPRYGARLGVLRPDPRFWVARGQFFRNRDGFRHHHPIGRAHRGGGFGGGIIAQHIGQLVAIKSRQMGFDGNAKGVKQQPAAQRPTGIGAIPNHKIIGHFDVSNLCAPTQGLPLKGRFKSIGKVPLQNHRQPRHHTHHQARCPCNLLVQPPLMIAKGPRQRIVWHDPPTHFV